MHSRSCIKTTYGGKGNMGKFIDREPRIFAAGVPTVQGDVNVPDNLKMFLPVDEVNALISDAIIPSKPPSPFAPLYHPIRKDQRNIFFKDSKLSQLISPPNPTKFQAFVEDLKETAYASYWKKPLGKSPDTTPKFPSGFDINGTTYGKKNPRGLNLYDTAFPKDPIPDKTPRSKGPGVQTDRKYCQPAFDPDLTYGYRTNVDKRGVYMKCALTDDRVVDGRQNLVVANAIKADFQEAYQPRIAQPLAPYNNITNVPLGHAFGKIKSPRNLAECLTTCEVNPGRKFFLDCLAHLNSLRRNLKIRFQPTNFRSMYSALKYSDKEKTGWLPKEVVYDLCNIRLIRLDPTLLEPLLENCFCAYHDNKIEYRTFCNIINYQKPLPNIPKVQDVSPDCLEFRTTYREMTKPGQELDERLRAGIPSGRYFDRDNPVVAAGQINAHKSGLPMETDVYSSISPSTMTLAHVSHRDVYAAREPHVVRKVFEDAGYKLSDERFRKAWVEAQNYHPHGVVCFETFRRAIEKIPVDLEPENVKNCR